MDEERYIPPEAPTEDPDRYIPPPQDTPRTLDQMATSFKAPEKETPEDRRIQRAREYYGQQGENYFGPATPRWVAERVPFAGTALNIGEYAKLHFAAKAKEEGTATPQDLDYIGLHQAKRDYEASKSTGQSIGDFVTKVPAMVGEFAAGGIAGRAVKGAVVGAMGERAAAPIAGYAAGLATQTAATPSLYIDKAVQINEENKRLPLDPRGFGKAGGLAVAQMAIMGAIGDKTGGLLPGEGVKQAAKRVGVQAGLGPFTQAAQDLVGYWTGLDTHYGTAEEILNGKYGDALKSATMHAFQYGTFALAHEIVTGAKGPEEAKKAAEKIKGVIDEAGKAGATPDQAAQVLNDKVLGKSPYGTDALSGQAAPVANGQAAQPKPYAKWPDADLVGIAKSLGMKKGETRAHAEEYLKKGNISEALLDQFEEAPKQAQVIQPVTPEAAPVEQAVVSEPVRAPASTEQARARFDELTAQRKANEAADQATDPAIHKEISDILKEHPEFRETSVLAKPRKVAPEPVEGPQPPEQRRAAIEARIAAAKSPEERARLEALLTPLGEALDVPEATATDKLHAVFAEAGLTPNEKYALVEKAKGRTFDEIRQDKELLGKVYTRQRVKQFEQSARQKIEEYTGRQFKSIYEDVNQADRASAKEDLASKTKVAKDAKDVVDYAESAGWAPEDPQALYHDRWLSYLERNDEEIKAFNPDQHAAHDRSVSEAITKGEEPPASGLIGAKDAGAEGAPDQSSSVRSESASAVQPRPASGPETPAPKAEGSQAVGASANAGGPEAAGNELTKDVPEATKQMAADFIASGNKWATEQLRKELADLYDPEIAKAILDDAKNTPPSDEAAKALAGIKSVGRGRQAQANAMVHRGDIQRELIKHQAGEEYHNVIREAQKNPLLAQEAEGLAHQAIVEGIQDGRSKGVEGVARETGLDADRLDQLLESEAIANEHGPTGSEQPSDVPFRREPGTAEPITGGSDFGRPVTPAERAGGSLGGGQEEQRTQGPTPEPRKETALANAVIDKELVSRGKEPLMSMAARANPEVWAEAMAVLDKDPMAGRDLVEKFSKNKTSIANRVETALVLHTKVAVENEHERTMFEVIKAMKPDSGVDAITREGLWAREAQLADKEAQVQRVARDIGTEAGGAFQFRKQLVAQDFSLGKMLMEASAAKGRPLTPEERLQVAEQAATIKELQTKLAEAEARLEEAAKAGKGKPGSKAHSEFVEAVANLKRPQRKFKDALQGDRDTNKGYIAQVGNWFTRLHQAFVISNPITFAKIAGASMWRIGITPAEEAVGAGLSALPGIQKIADGAPRQGGGSLKIEGKAFASAFTQGLVDAWKTLPWHEGKSDLDVAFGNKSYPRGWLGWVAELHAVLKAPAVRAEFTRSYLKRVDHALANGQDATSPAAVLRIGEAAYKDSQAAKFQQDSVVIDGMNKGLAKLKAETSPGPAQALGHVIDFSMPVRRVPWNMAMEVAQTAVGTATGSVRAAIAFRQGLENVPVAQRELIMQDLKKGLLGAAALAVGYYNRDKIGGFFSGKRKEGDEKAEEIGGAPAAAFHHPLLEVMQMGSTIGRASEEVDKKTGKKQGLGTGLGAGVAGLAEKTPFVREAKEIHGLTQYSAKERGYYFGEFAKSLAVPQLVQWLAGQTDKNAKGEPVKRKPASVGQHVEMGIPGLRQTVPAK